MKTPLVTVVLPIYNVEKYLDRCVTSVVNQTYRNLEIILVDDGSPDNCPQMCDAWAEQDSRIKVVHKKNAGLGMARNTGIEHATGAYICFFDSDDYIAGDTVEKACHLAVHAQADIVVFGMSNVNNRGEVVKQRIPQAEKTIYAGDEVQARFLPDLVDCRHRDVAVKNLTLSAWSCLYSMELIRKTGWRFVSERQNISEDSYSLIWLYKYVSRVAVLPEALYFYCANGASLTQTYRADRFSRIKQFYMDTVAMAETQGYNDAVMVAISGLYISFTIAAMKQIEAANMDTKDKKQLLRQITEDTLTRKILSDARCCYSSRAREVLLWAMRKELHPIVWWCLQLQRKREGK